MKIIAIIIMGLVIQSCNSSNELNQTKLYNVNDTSVTQTSKTNTVAEKDAINKGKLLIFISEYIKKEFDKSKQDLIDQGKEYGYEISETKRLGDMLKYTVKIPDVECYQEFSCMPKRGESTIIATGDKETVKMLYDQAKLAKKWESVNKIENGESLESTKNWKKKPLKTRVTLKYVIYESESIFTTRLKLTVTE